MIQVLHEDILKIKVDAIVNPANVSLLRGGGLCGLIHKKAGIALEMKCKTFGKQLYGQAITTPSYDLINCDYIIHACGPRWIHGSEEEKSLLANTHVSIIKCAIANNLTSIAIPAISTGIYRFPVAAAADIAINTISHSNDAENLDVIFVLSEIDKFKEYERLLLSLNDD